jgi:iron complex transport system substrate-binding protein
VALAAAVSLALAACAGGSPTVPPGASSTVGPGATGTPTPPPSASPSPAATFPLTLTDDEGTAVTLAAEPARVVSLTPAVTETLFALGAGERVVAKVEDIANYPPEAADLPIVATYQGVDVERIVALDADLVIAGGADFNQGKAIDRLRGTGIPVLVVAATSVDTALADIELIGAAVGRAEAATALSAAMRAEFDAVAAATRDLGRPRVLYEVSYGDGTLYTVPDDSLYAEMLRLAGSEPITTDSSYKIALEKVLVAEPEIILLGDAAYGVTAEQVVARPGWGPMTALKAGALRAVDDVLITRPGPRLTEGLRALAVAIHPEVSQALEVIGGPYILQPTASPSPSP